MTVADTGGICQTIRGLLDSFISHELGGRVLGEVERHLDTCAVCSAELQWRGVVRARLKEAVRQPEAPLALRMAIRERLQSQAPSGRQWFPFVLTRRTVLATAAGGVLAATGIWRFLPRTRLPGIKDVPAQDAYIQDVAGTIAAIMRVGLRDHIHCTVFRVYPKNSPTAEQMISKMGPLYQGLVSIVNASVPTAWRIIMAHQCSYQGRRFVHLILRNTGSSNTDNDQLLSLAISRKQPGETLASLQPSSSQAGVALYQTAAERYQISGFETDRHLAYIVSGSGKSANVAIAARLASPVREFLASIRT